MELYAMLSTLTLGINMHKIPALLAIALTVISASAAAQTDSPSKPIQVIVGFPAGGGTDILARVLAQEAEKFLGRPVIVVNKPGATGTLAVSSVAAAKPDGYMLGVTASSSLTTAQFLQDVPTDLLERTTALVAVGRLRNALLVQGNSSLRSVKDLIEQARRNPGKVSIGTPGAGTKSGLVLQAIILREKLDISMVPFKGEAPAVTALLGGHITAASSTASTWERHVAAGTLRIIASEEEDRLDSDPTAPTLIEQGLPYAVSLIFYAYGPAGLPAAVTKRLVDAFGAATRTPAYRDMATKNAIDIGKPISGETLDRFLAEDRAKTGAMVKMLGIKKN